MKGIPPIWGTLHFYPIGGVFYPLQCYKPVTARVTAIFYPLHAIWGVTDRKASKPSDTNGCNTVTDRIPPEGGKNERGTET
jgi:hypothetical protein